MDEVDVKDPRGFFKLPQEPEQSGYGYYTYGTPSLGRAQFAHPTLLSILNFVEHRWQGMDPRKIGFGNISLSGGVKFKPHEGHQSGLDVDVRPLRKDGLHIPVTWRDPQYDGEATAKLIDLFFQAGIVKVIYFNDLSIPRVKPLFHHDDHFHVTVLPGTRQ